MINAPLAAGPHTFSLVYSGDFNYYDTTATVPLGTLKRRTARH